MTTTDDVIKSAASVARDVAEGKLSPAELDQAVAEECRALVGNVVGPSDPLFDLQIDIARQVLERGGIAAAELAEWLSVARRRAGEVTGPSDADLSTSVPHSPDSAASETETEATDEGEGEPDEN